jgi:hypothetical protein
VVHPRAGDAPEDKRVVRQQKAILDAELEGLAGADDLVAEDVPGSAVHGLEAEAVVLMSLPWMSQLRRA